MASTLRRGIPPRGMRKDIRHNPEVAASRNGSHSLAENNARRNEISSQQLRSQSEPIDMYEQGIETVDLAISG
jgi:hypothetical protein